MKKAAIAIDAWKLPIFSRILVERGFSYTQESGLTEDTYLLIVETDRMQALAQACLACNQEASKKGKPK
jgi:hypothetical protein